MFDNITSTADRRLVLQEDPGGQSHLARVWLYDVSTDKLVEVARHNPDYFSPGAPGLLSTGEESSGVIDASEIFGAGAFLLDVQPHFSTDAETVEGGQLLLMRVPSNVIK